MKMPSRKSGLSSAVRGLLSDFPEDVQHIPAALQDVALNFVIPLAILLGAIGGVLKLISIVIKAWFPPSARELHRYVATDHWDVF